MKLDRDEMNESMLKLYGFSFDECERDYRKYCGGPSTDTEGYYVLKTTRKKKGANKGYKETHTLIWNENRKRSDYLAGLCPKERGLWLCMVEYHELCEDRWWDTPTYRATHLQSYRRRITEIRKTYGLTSAEVSEFMRV